MAVKQVFETYVYAHLLSSSAMPPFVLAYQQRVYMGPVSKGGSRLAGDFISAWAQAHPPPRIAG
ncbi:hypothetical protein BOH74_13360 [Pseudomonas versuta]|uniref:Uncharacterized protein n=1 Tax=Pseudomonas versuta TaxID=1788301 RepID=A0A854A0L7_9PSED|nr:hypothetical protein BOH74_13360 [Pseudomonas versuta]